MNKKGLVYIGDRNTGKTTRLWKIYEEAVMKGKTVLVIDSATEHVSKSIVKRILRVDLKKVVCIHTCNVDMIVFPEEKMNCYPKEILENTNSKVYVCDAALYLEKGYDFPAGELREQQRVLYKKFSMQVIRALIDRVDVIIMDEIELIPESRDVFEMAYNRNIEVYMSLHSEEGLTGLNDLFSIERIY